MRFLKCAYLVASEDVDYYLSIIGTTWPRHCSPSAILMGFNDSARMFFRFLAYTRIVQRGLRMAAR